jgi:pimeloyl-ACP methyl ester carboxylesterase/class 3 adenylate cyclase
MDAPIRYARNGDVHIAYQVVGDGPFDLVYSPGIWSNLEIMWEWPAWRDYLLRLASFSRLVLFDMRGVGLSDRGLQPPILELQAGDLRSVMDAVGCRSAAVFGGARASAMTMLFAAAHPDRVRALVLYAPNAKTVRSPDWPYGKSEEEQAAFLARFISEMGTGQNLDLQAPAHDREFVRWWARFERLVASPGAYAELAEILTALDVRRVLPSIQAPTLVLHRRDDRVVPVAQGRAVAERIAGARFVELPGINHIPWMGDWEPLVDEVAEFLTGTRPPHHSDRVLATVLFTDIVQSTERIARLGDHRWREMLAEHRALVRRQLGAHRGVERDTAGDGFMATFEGPARAIHCATAIIDAARADGLEVRAGLHTGECEVIDGGITGIAVHVAARIAATSQPCEVRVSSTVRDLVAGSGIRFDDLGLHALKGVDEEWRLLRVRGE